MSVAKKIELYNLIVDLIQLYEQGYDYIDIEVEEEDSVTISVEDEYLCQEESRKINDGDFDKLI